MRLRDIIIGIKKGKIPFIEERTGPNRKKRREVTSQARNDSATKHGGAKTRPRDWRRKRKTRRKMVKESRRINRR